MQHLKKIRIFILIITCTNPIIAQKIDNITVSINPTSFMDSDAGIKTGVGFDVGKKTCIFSEFGFLFYDAFRNTETDKNAIKGFIIKPSFRYYFKKPKTNNISEGSYVAGEFLLKSVKYYQNTPIGILDAQRNTIYSYIGGYTIRKNVLGFSILFGKKSFMDKNKKLGLDLYTGIGFRNRTLAVKDLPDGSAVNENTFLNEKRLNIGGASPNEKLIGSFSLGMRIIYRIN
jgi:hypothetical protein